MSLQTASSIATIAAFVVYIFVEWSKIKERFSASTPSFVKFVVLMAFLCFFVGSLLVFIWMFSDIQKYLSLGRLGMFLVSIGIEVMSIWVIVQAVKDKRILLPLMTSLFFVMNFIVASGVLLSFLNN